MSKEQWEFNLEDALKMQQVECSNNYTADARNFRFPSNCKNFQFSGNVAAKEKDEVEDSFVNYKSSFGFYVRQ